MKYPAIEKAILNGAGLHAFRSGGGLRVVRLEKKPRREQSSSKLIGYGEHPNIEPALAYCEEDTAAGGRDYNKVYGEGKLHTHYLTGTTEASSALDRWVLAGYTFDIYKSPDAEGLTFEGEGYVHHGIHEDIYKLSETKVVTWKRPDGAVMETYHRGTRYVSGLPDGRNAFFHTAPLIVHASNLDELLVVANEGCKGWENDPVDPYEILSAM